MASAKKCDRCGVFYEKNTEFKETIGFIKFTVDGMCFSTIADEYVSHKDLCDDCISKLYAFLDGRGDCMTVSDQMKKRCEKCIYAKFSKSPTLGWPCYRCVGAISTLEKPTKYASSRLLLDFYEEV